MRQINWAKGSFRIWIVLTLLWAGLMFVDERPDERLWFYLDVLRAIETAEALLQFPQDPVTLPGGELSTRAEVVSDLARLRHLQTETWSGMERYVKSVLIPSLLVLGVGILIGWAIRGFSRGKKK